MDRIDYQDRVDSLLYNIRGGDRTGMRVLTERSGKDRTGRRIHRQTGGRERKLSADTGGRDSQRDSTDS